MIGFDNQTIRFEKSEKDVRPEKKDRSQADAALRKLNENSVETEINGDDDARDAQIDADSSAEDPAVELYDESSVTVEPNILSDEEISSLGNDNNLTYKTKQVAAFLGISEQLVRNYCNDFDEFLDIEKTTTGQRRFRKKDIIQLSQILQLKQAKNFDVPQTKDYLRGETGKVVLAQPEDKVGVILALIHEEVKNAITEAKEDIKAIEQKHDSETENKLIEEIRAKDEEIRQLKEMVLQSNAMMDEMKKSMQESNQAIMEKLERKRFSFFRRS